MVAGANVGSGAHGVVDRQAGIREARVSTTQHNAQLTKGVVENQITLRVLCISSLRSLACCL